MNVQGDFQLRIRLGETLPGPGKADLLESIRDTGSISAAGRRISMSRRRAWLLVEQSSLYFGAPLVATLTGGRGRGRGRGGGGGAGLSPLGEEILAIYRRMQQSAGLAIADDLARLHRLRR